MAQVDCSVDPRPVAGIGAWSQNGPFSIRAAGAVYAAQRPLPTASYQGPLCHSTVQTTSAVGRGEPSLVHQHNILPLAGAGLDTECNMKIEAKVVQGWERVSQAPQLLQHPVSMVNEVHGARLEPHVLRSKYRGVSYDKKKRKWRVQIKVAALGKSGVSVGYFDTEEAAARAYDRAAISLLGRETCKSIVNFSIDDYKNEQIPELCGKNRDEVKQSLKIERARVMMMYKQLSRRRLTHRRRTSKFLGVGSSNRKNQWQARILYHGRVTHLGYYSSEEEAARVYDRVAISLNGEQATTNFPIEEYSNEKECKLVGLSREDLQRALGVKPMDKSSQYRGVSKKKGKWEAKVMLNRKWAYRELFETEEQAARAYDCAVWRLKPKEARAYVNFKDSCPPDVAEALARLDADGNGTLECTSQGLPVTAKPLLDAGLLFDEEVGSRVVATTPRSKTTEAMDSQPLRAKILDSFEGESLKPRAAAQSLFEAQSWQNASWPPPFVAAPAGSAAMTVCTLPVPRRRLCSSYPGSVGSDFMQEPDTPAHPLGLGSTSMFTSPFLGGMSVEEFLGTIAPDHAGYDPSPAKPIQATEPRVRRSSLPGVLGSPTHDVKRQWHGSQGPVVRSLSSSCFTSGTSNATLQGMPNGAIQDTHKGLGEKYVIGSLPLATLIRPMGGSDVLSMDLEHDLDAAAKLDDQRRFVRRVSVAGPCSLPSIDEKSASSGRYSAPGECLSDLFMSTRRTSVTGSSPELPLTAANAPHRPGTYPGTGLHEPYVSMAMPQRLPAPVQLPNTTMAMPPNSVQRSQSECLAIMASCPLSPCNAAARSLSLPPVGALPACSAAAFGSNSSNCSSTGVLSPDSAKLIHSLLGGSMGRTDSVAREMTAAASHMMCHSSGSSSMSMHGNNSSDAWAAVMESPRYLSHTSSNGRGYLSNGSGMALASISHLVGEQQELDLQAVLQEIDDADMAVTGMAPMPMEWSR